MRESSFRFWVALAALVVGAQHFMAGQLVAEESSPRERLPENVEITHLESYPESIELARPYAYRQVLFTAVTATGDRIDVTRLAELEITPAETATVSPTAPRASTST